MHIHVTEARKIMGRLKKGDDLLQALTTICQEMGITLGEVKAIGAVSQARIGYYHQDTRQYEWLDLPRPLEILALEGNISLKDGKPFVHAHVMLSDERRPGFRRPPGRRQHRFCHGICYPGA